MSIPLRATYNDSALSALNSLIDQPHPLSFRDNTVSRTLLAPAVAFSLLLFGCAARGPQITIKQRRAFEDSTRGTTAVLKVTNPDPGEAVGAKSVWGTVYPPNAKKSFAELLAHFARRTGKMKVLPPAEVEERLQVAGLEPTITPTSAQLSRFAGTLGCQTYLEAVVERWRYTYILTRQKAVVIFSLRCMEPDNPTPLWSAEVSYSTRGKTERQAAAQVLQELFHRLRARR